MAVQHRPFPSQNQAFEADGPQPLSVVTAGCDPDHSWIGGLHGQSCAACLLHDLLFRQVLGCGCRNMVMICCAILRRRIGSWSPRSCPARSRWRPTRSRVCAQSESPAPSWSRPRGALDTLIPHLTTGGAYLAVISKGSDRTGTAKGQRRPDVMTLNAKKAERAELIGLIRARSAHPETACISHGARAHLPTRRGDILHEQRLQH